MVVRRRRGGADAVVTKQMRAVEARVGAPIRVAVVAAINETGSMAGAAEALELPISTLRMWCWRLGIRVGLAAALPEERAS